MSVVQWLAGQPGAASILVGLPAVEARSAGEGRGLGLFAPRTIPAFTQILRDPIACLMKPTDDLPELYERFSELPELQQTQYTSLSYRDDLEKDAVLTQKLLQRGYTSNDAKKRIQVGHIMHNNAFTVDVGGPHGAGHRALFLSVARINHSCTPNAHVSFYPPSPSTSVGRMVVHTLRELHAGEEVLISYFSILMSKPDRQTKARKWGFDCACSACDGKQLHHVEREEVLKDIRDFKSNYSMVMSGNKHSPGSLKSLIIKGSALVEHCLGDLSLRPALPDLFDDLGMLEAKMLLSTRRENEREAVVAFLEKSVVWEARITGTESVATNKRLEKLHQFATRRGRPHVGEQYKFEYQVAWTARYIPIGSLTTSLSIKFGLLKASYAKRTLHHPSKRTSSQSAKRFQTAQVCLAPKSRHEIYGLAKHEIALLSFERLTK
ncbi:uncharacterized protein MYCFIDRAFT_192326 [Pseudocercospora fijiensis CIRAD86]|uniref:SET domain-containing protein n=1 Tax=Pseudocercospora fijiensis (strain CIRAD86) TaxID=383855 RepID=N1QAP0_PSEFD|nr:uncharacterized protein MYCFIDRAFT_192326 [Pseudocercospora fijiensis CIRAD86]EME88062.1 hypothetical protein MYCFIDRAFT_192326 [Pseudocercospora fijiensis CIRAD86]